LSFLHRESLPRTWCGESMVFKYWFPVFKGTSLDSRFHGNDETSDNLYAAFNIARDNCKKY
jgi:hypothetical protein